MESLKIKIGLGVFVALIGFGILLYGKFGKRKKAKTQKARRRKRKR